jgi:hypothetical protein
VNDPPVPVGMVFSPSLLSLHATNYVLLARDNTNAIAVLDGSRSYDVDLDRLSYAWYESGQAAPFATGVWVSVNLKVRTHYIILQVSDGTDFGRETLGVQVMTAGAAVSELVLLVDQSALRKEDKHHLDEELKHSIEEFNRSHYKEGGNHLREFVKKLREHDFVKRYPTLGSQWQTTAQNILTVMGLPLK